MIYNNILKAKMENKKKIIYFINYEKIDDFKKLSDDEIDKFFKKITNDLFKGIESKIEIKEKSTNDYSKNDLDRKVMTIFFEEFFNEFKSAKSNIEIIKNKYQECNKLVSKIKKFSSKI